MITTVNLAKRYGHLVAIKNLNLHIEQGEFFGFLGPNGAGKTTTIKILVGLLKPSAGTATIAGYDIQRAPQEAKRQIGFIPDRPFLYEKLSGREFLRFVADLHGLEERRHGRAARSSWSCSNSPPGAMNSSKAIRTACARSWSSAPPCCISLACWSWMNR